MDLVKPSSSPDRSKPVGPLDSRGRELQTGDEILLNLRGPIFFRVSGIVPNVDPTGPKDLYRLHVGLMVDFVAKGGVKHGEFTRVCTAQEAGPMNFVITDARPDPGGV